MRKHLWTKLALVGFIFCLTSCQPGGGDFVPIPQDNTVLESYNDKKDVVQVYDNTQILLKVHGNWDVENGASSFYISITNKTRKGFTIKPEAVNFNAGIDEKIVVPESSFWVADDFPAGNRTLQKDKTKENKIKIEGGQTTIVSKGFYLDIKSFSKSKNYFLGKEVRIDVPITIDGQDAIYKFAFKYDSYQ